MGCAPSTTGVSHQEEPKKLTFEARVLRGQNLRLQGQFELALKELDGVIKEDQNMARAYLERGNVQLELKAWDAAVDDLSLAIKLQENIVMGYFMRAHALVHLKRFDEAVKDYQEALNLDPENAQVQELRIDIRKAMAENEKEVRGTGTPGTPTKAYPSILVDEEEDPFAGLDTPKEKGGKGAKLCLVCLDNERGCRLRPCLHAALCVECAEDLKSRHFGCPICGDQIASVETGAFLHTYANEDAQREFGSIAKNDASTLLSPARPSAQTPTRHSRSAPLASNLSSSFLHSVAEQDQEGRDEAPSTWVPQATFQGVPSTQEAANPQSEAAAGDDAEGVSAAADEAGEGRAAATAGELGSVADTAVEEGQVSAAGEAVAAVATVTSAGEVSQADAAPAAP